MKVMHYIGYGDVAYCVASLLSVKAKGELPSNTEYILYKHPDVEYNPKLDSLYTDVRSVYREDIAENLSKHEYLGGEPHRFESTEVYRKYAFNCYTKYLLFLEEPTDDYCIYLDWDTMVCKGLNWSLPSYSDGQTIAAHAYKSGRTPLPVLNLNNGVLMKNKEFNGSVEQQNLLNTFWDAKLFNQAHTMSVGMDEALTGCAFWKYGYSYLKALKSTHNYNPRADRKLNYAHHAVVTHFYGETKHLIGTDDTYGQAGKDYLAYLIQARTILGE